jgi:hypothetical protein
MGQVLLVFAEQNNTALHLASKLHLILVLLVKLTVKKLLGTFHIELWQSSLLTCSIVLIMFQFLHFDSFFSLGYNCL